MWEKGHCRDHGLGHGAGRGAAIRGRSLGANSSPAGGRAGARGQSERRCAHPLRFHQQRVAASLCIAASFRCCHRFIMAALTRVLWVSDAPDLHCLRLVTLNVSHALVFLRIPSSVKGLLSSFPYFLIGLFFLTSGSGKFFVDLQQESFIGCEPVAVCPTLLQGRPQS